LRNTENSTLEPRKVSVVLAPIRNKVHLEPSSRNMIVIVSTVIDHQNPYFSERSPELEGDKIIIQAPGRAERSLHMRINKRT